MTEGLQEKKVSISTGFISLVLQLLALAVATGVVVQKQENSNEKLTALQADLISVQHDITDIKVNYGSRLSVIEDRQRRLP